jgi:hypothetical protein
VILQSDCPPCTLAVKSPRGRVRSASSSSYSNEQSDHEHNVEVATGVETSLGDPRAMSCPPVRKDSDCRLYYQQSLAAFAVDLLWSHLLVCCCANKAFRRLPARCFSYSCGLQGFFYGGNTGSNSLGTQAEQETYKLNECENEGAKRARKNRREFISRTDSSGACRGISDRSQCDADCPSLHSLVCPTRNGMESYTSQ